MKSSQNPTTPTNQDNIVQFDDKQPTWLQQAKRLHDDGHEGFRSVCRTGRMCAQSLAFPRDYSFFTLIDNMQFIQKDSFNLDLATERIREIYNEAYSLSEPENLPHHLAEVIPFPMADVVPFPINEKEVAE